MNVRNVMILSALLAGACGSNASAQGTPLHSGVYEQLVLAVGADGKLVGRYREDQGEAPAKSCAFSLSGRADGKGNADVVARSGGTTLKGRLSVAAEGVRLSLPNARTFPGCGMVLMPEIDSGLDLDRIASGTWTDLVQVKPARLPLKPQPAAPAGRAYVVKGDVLGVVGRQAGNVHVVYPSDRARPTEGWVAAGDVMPLSD